MKLYTHKELTALAVKWLKKPLGNNGAGCHIAVSEFPSGWTGEIPDAIGFRVTSEPLGGSIVCEVKVSRGDFLADKKKPHRNGEALGMGNHRFYVAPEGLIQPSELPTGWGLVEITSRGGSKCVLGYPVTTNMRIRKQMFDDTHFESDKDREMNILVRLLSRIGNVEELNNIKRQNRRLEAENAKLTAKVGQLNQAEILSAINEPKSDKNLIGGGMERATKLLKVKN